MSRIEQLLNIISTLEHEKEALKMEVEILNKILCKVEVQNIKLNNRIYDIERSSKKLRKLTLSSIDLNKK